jgi:hypothetical protein
MGSNDWMNDQLRARTGTTVNLDEAGEEINAALRGRPSPARVKQGRTKLDPEPLPTAGIKEWQRWAAEAGPLMDSEGRVPGEKGYTRPAADQLTRWASATAGGRPFTAEPARPRGRNSDDDRSAS